LSFSLPPSPLPYPLLLPYLILVSVFARADEDGRAHCSLPCLHPFAFIPQICYDLLAPPSVLTLTSSVLIITPWFFHPSHTESKKSAWLLGEKGGKLNFWFHPDFLQQIPPPSLLPAPPSFCWPTPFVTSTKTQAVEVSCQNSSFFLSFDHPEVIEKTSTIVRPLSREWSRST
jgi:hypothetical protein